MSVSVAKKEHLIFNQALTLEVNPLYFMFPTAIATSFAFMLPVATPPNAVVFSYGFVKVLDMVRNRFKTITGIFLCSHMEYFFSHIR